LSKDAGGGAPGARLEGSPSGRSLYSRIKRFLIGSPIASKLAHHERLAVLLALPVFASDALSSVAYASEEILLSLRAGGPEALRFLVPIAFALVALLWVVVFSYYQTIHAYPQGGGSYRVSSDNLGPLFGQLAGGALLIGYVLTVAVSVSAGAAAIVAMFPTLQTYAPAIACGAVAVIAIVNLRGSRESGAVFAIPTYSFVVFVLVLAVIGMVQAFAHGVPPQPPNRPIEPQNAAFVAVGAALLLKAFAAGCTALTGTEAIADGVLAFRAPEAQNAAKTLVLMGIMLSVLFVSISWCAQHFGIVPMEFDQPGYKTVLAQIAEALFGAGSPLFYLSQVATALILFLAANTGFADFPRLSMFMARDGYLPRQLTSLGDRLVFQNGILTLALLSIGLILLKSADTHSLIPMYAVGVFLSFTLSQSGMVGRWVRSRIYSWKLFVSLFGALVTGSVTVVLLVNRWGEGAWIALAALAALMVLFRQIRKHYDWLAKMLNIAPTDKLQPVETTVLLSVPRMHKGILQAIAYSKALTKDVRAIHVTLDPSSAKQIKEQWNDFGSDIPLVILESPYRSLIRPIVEYVDQTLAESPDHMVTVIVPQAIPRRWWQGLLHSNIALLLKLALASRKNVVISNVRYFLE